MKFADDYAVKRGIILEQFDTPILNKVLIRATRERVYDAMTTSEGLDGWFTEGTIVDRKSGGEMTLKWVN